MLKDLLALKLLLKPEDNMSFKTNRHFKNITKALDCLECLLRNSDSKLNLLTLEFAHV